jgi:hypothetical protein
VASVNIIKSGVRSVLFTIVLGTGIAGCEKAVVKGKDVGIYVLENSSLVPGACKVDPSTAVLAGIPTLQNEDIVSYSASTYTYTLTDRGYAAISGLTDHTRFAVTVDGKTIFLGIVKPNFSSSSCDQSIVMTNYGVDNTMHFQLGYPGLPDNVVIDDQRNNTLLLTTLKAQGKLIP